MSNTKSRRSYLIVIGSVVFSGMLLGLTGCFESVKSDQTAAESKTIKERLSVDREALMTKRVATAIQVGDDLYMVPSGVDEQGCEMFNPFSNNSPSVKAIHYRQADGSFNIVRDPAVCKVEMVAIGLDEDGCERYQAQPVNPDLSPTEVIYYRDADGRYMVYKPKPGCV